MEFQNTLTQLINVSGIGVHSGANIDLRILPAKANRGIIFIRTDLIHNKVVKAHFSNVVDTTQCTVIANEYGVRVATIEHLMYALWFKGIDNAVIEVSGPEIPILDGSSKLFIDLIEKNGITVLNEKRKILQVMKEVELEIDDKKITISPSDALSIDFTIQFNHPCLGEQTHIFDENAGIKNQDIGKARTFGFVKDLEKLNSMGLAKGASLENAIGIDDNGVVNKEGLRFKNEPVKHKILDCIGDLYLAGLRIRGHVKALKGGHGLNNKLLRKLFDTPLAFEIVEA